MTLARPTGPAAARLFRYLRTLEVWGGGVKKDGLKFHRVDFVPHLLFLVAAKSFKNTCQQGTDIMCGN